MGLEEDIERFFGENYGYAAHAPGRVAGKTLWGEVDDLLTHAHYFAGEGITPQARFTNSFEILKTSLRNPENLAQHLARAYLLGISYNDVVTSRVSGATERFAPQWSAWLAESESKISEKVPFRSEARFLERAIVHWKLASDETVFGDNAFHGTLIHFNLGNSLYRLSIAKGEYLTVSERTAILEEALDHMQMSLGSGNGTGRFSEDYNHELVARICYDLIFSKIEMGNTRIGDIANILQVAQQHKKLSREPSYPFGFFINQSGLKFAEGFVEYLNGNFGKAESAFEDGIEGLTRTMREFAASARRSNVFPLDNLIREITVLLGSCMAEHIFVTWRREPLREDCATARDIGYFAGVRQMGRYLQGALDYIEEQDSLFKRQTRITDPYYKFMPRWEGVAMPSGKSGALNWVNWKGSATAQAA